MSEKMKKCECHDYENKLEYWRVLTRVKAATRQTVDVLIVLISCLGVYFGLTVATYYGIATLFTIAIALIMLSFYASLEMTKHAFVENELENDNEDPSREYLNAKKSCSFWDGIVNALNWTASVFFFAGLGLVLLYMARIIEQCVNEPRR